MTRSSKLRMTAALVVLIAVAGVRLASTRNGRVRVAYLPVMASLPVFIAEDQHLFAKQGLRPQSISFSTSNDMVNALVSGQVDVLPAVALVPLIHLEIQHPGKVRVFSHSRMRRENSTYRIVVRNDSPLKRLQDLSNKKFGVFPGTSATRLVSAFLRRNSVDPAGITFVQLPPSAQVSSLETGAVDALFAYEPVALVSEPGRYRTLSNSVYAELSEPCPLGVSVIARDFERANRDMSSRSVAAIQEAIAFMSAHPDRAKSLLPRFTRMTPEMAARVNVADMTLSNLVDADSLQRFIDLLYEIGEIPEKLDAHRLIDPTR
jgi:ABC-type nitrate/sulfonate/bicarbonate transport system substrate-binding protein